MLAGLMTASWLSLVLHGVLVSAGPLIRTKRDMHPWDKGPLDDMKGLYPLWQNRGNTPHETTQMWNEVLAVLPRERQPWQKRPTSDPSAYENRHRKDLEWTEPEWGMPTLSQYKDGCIPCTGAQHKGSGKPTKYLSKFEAKPLDAGQTKDGNEWPTMVSKLEICMCLKKQYEESSWKEKEGQALLNLLNRLPTAIRKDLPRVYINDDPVAEDYVIRYDQDKVPGQLFQASISLWLNYLRIFSTLPVTYNPRAVNGKEPKVVAPFFEKFKSFISSAGPSYNTCLPTDASLASYRTAIREVITVYFAFWYWADPNAAGDLNRRNIWNASNLACMWPAVLQTMKHIQEERGGAGLPLPEISNLFPLTFRKMTSYPANIQNEKANNTVADGNGDDKTIDKNTAVDPPVWDVEIREMVCVESVIKSNRKVVSGCKDLWGDKASKSTPLVMFGYANAFSPEFQNVQPDLQVLRNRYWCENDILEELQLKSKAQGKASLTQFADPTNYETSTIQLEWRDENKSRNSNSRVAFRSPRISVYRKELCQSADSAGAVNSVSL